MSDLLGDFFGGPSKPQQQQQQQQAMQPTLQPTRTNASSANIDLFADFANATTPVSAPVMTPTTMTSSTPATSNPSFDAFLSGFDLTSPTQATSSPAPVSMPMSSSSLSSSSPVIAPAPTTVAASASSASSASLLSPAAGKQPTKLFSAFSKLLSGPSSTQTSTQTAAQTATPAPAPAPTPIVSSPAPSSLASSSVGDLSFLGNSGVLSTSSSDSAAAAATPPASAGPETIQLLCSLCMTMVNVDDLEKHSKICASGARAKQSQGLSPVATNEALPEAPLDAAWLVRVHPQIEIRFLQPQKHQNLLSSYWSFELATKTKLPQFDQQQLSVRRSFADFEWLRDVLSNQCPHLLIPPLLGKSKPANLSDTEFAASTQRYLSKFLNEICFHAELQRVPAFSAFLSCSDASAFADAKKQAADLVAAANTSRLTLKERAKQAMSSLPGAMSALASGNLNAVAQASATTDDEEGKAMLQLVGEHATEAKALAEVMRQLRDATRDQHRALLIYSAMSSKMSPLVTSLGAGPAVEARLAPHASTLANTLLADAASTRVHARRLLFAAIEPIEFWIAKAEEAEALCTRLVEARRVMGVLRNAQVKAITSATQANGAKQSAALESLIQRRVEAEQWVQRHESTIRQELSQFDESRVREFKRIMFLLALHQTTAHREQAGVWHGSVARLN